jgi:hypothetical protein
VNLSFLTRATLAALGALSLAGCIDSAAPIMTGAEPVLGPQLHLQFYGLHKGVADDPEQASYRWDGARYAHVSGGMADVAAFSLHPFEGGTFIVQSMPLKKTGGIEYAVMRKLTEGVFHVVPVDEDDADAATRAANCKPAGHSCRIETRDALYALARATAAKHKADGGLAIRLPDTLEKRP